MDIRNNYKKISKINNKSVYDYLSYINYKIIDNTIIDNNQNMQINFDTLNYYNNKKDFEYVGYLNTVNGIDIFKIRKNR